MLTNGESGVGTDAIADRQCLQVARIAARLPSATITCRPICSPRSITVETSACAVIYFLKGNESRDD